MQHLELLGSSASILWDGSCHHFNFHANELMLRNIYNVKNCGRWWRELIEVISPATFFCANVRPTSISRNTFDDYYFWTSIMWTTLAIFLVIIFYDIQKREIPFY